jgi:hypothetical protein
MKFNAKTLPLEVLRLNPAFADVVSETEPTCCPKVTTFRVATKAVSKSREFKKLGMGAHAQAIEQIQTGVKWLGTLKAVP